MDPRLLVGRNIARLRSEKGLSQTQLAHRIDPTNSRMGQAYISKVENGQKNISIVTLGVFAEALGVELSDLMKKIE